MNTLQKRTRGANATSFASISGAAVSARIDRDGWYCLEDAVDVAWISDAAREAQLHATRSDYEVILDDIESNPASAGSQIVHEPAVRALLEAIVATARPGFRIEGQPIRASLRVLVGEDPLDRPLSFHYDRSVVSMVIPVQIPAGSAGASGELILVPNRRPYRRFVAVNVLEKAVVQTRRFRSWFVKHLPARTVVVPLVVGNAYIFWGYRSYHSTLPCPADSVRVTLIVHFGEVHDGSPMLALSKSTGRRTRLRGDSTIRILPA